MAVNNKNELQSASWSKDIIGIGDFVYFYANRYDSCVGCVTPVDR